MKKKFEIGLSAVFVFLSAGLWAACAPFSVDSVQPEKWDPRYADFYEKPSDPKATPEAVELFHNLLKLRGKGCLFGHSESTNHGILASGDAWSEGVWQPGCEADPWNERSDIKTVCGDYPAIIAWDMPFYDDKMGQHMINAYKRGSISLVGWHPNNFASDKQTFKRTDEVSGKVIETEGWAGFYASGAPLSPPKLKRILPGGDHHEAFKAELKRRADILNAIVCDKAGDGTAEKVPFIFKLFHEHNGGWFWWGGIRHSADNFIALWRFTVDYLRNDCGVHQMLVAYCPDVFITPLDYLAKYPGSRYVDVMGHDNYHCYGQPNSSASKALFQTLSNIGRAFGKPAGLTETGAAVNGGIPNAAFWTHHLLPVVNQAAANEIDFVLFWRNQSTEHFFVPYGGHPSAADFKAFASDPYIWFAKEWESFIQK